MISTAPLNRAEIARQRRQIVELQAELAQASAADREIIESLIADARRAIAWCEAEIAREQVAAARA